MSKEGGDCDICVIELCNGLCGDGGATGPKDEDGCLVVVGDVLNFESGELVGFVAGNSPGTLSETAICKNISGGL